MSFSYSTYIGPYVACAVQRRTATETWRSCPNAGCPNYGTHMPPGFCSHCGAPVADTAFPVVVDAVDDDEVRAHLDSREAFSLHRIQPTDIHNETHAFEGYFAVELAALRTAYGEASVSVRWGVIQDYC